MTPEGAPEPKQLEQLRAQIQTVKDALAEVEQQYDSVTGELVLGLQEMAKLDVTSKPDKLREAANQLRALEVHSLDLQLRFDKLEMRTEEFSTLLQSLEPAVAGGETKEISEANELAAVIGRRIEYFSHAEARQSEFFHRMSETISLAYSQLRESNDRVFQNRIAKYGMWIAVAVAIFSAASILIEIFKIVRGLA